MPARCVYGAVRNVSEQYSVSIVLPAYNEEGSIGDALRRVTAAAERLCAEHEVIVVDDGSTDTTALIVGESAGADPRIRLISHGRNRGYGEALRTGFRAARLELVFFTDADNQFDPEELEKFLPWTDTVDVVAGYRLDRKDGFGRRLTAWAWNMLVRLLFYVPVRDIDCAFKLFRRQIFDSLDLQSIGAMVNTELMVKLGRSGAGVIEIGVTHYPRTSGNARGAHPRVILLAMSELVRMYRRLQSTSVSSLRHPALTAPPLVSVSQREATDRNRSRVVVIGGGIAGCATALKLARQSHSVTLIERSPHLGGLLVSFSVGGTPLECFYHHIFPHEHDIIALIQALGLEDRLGWHESGTGVLVDGRIWPFTSPGDLLRFKPLPVQDRLRAGVGALRMRRVQDWQRLDEISASDWLRSYCGDGAGRVLWDPLLAAKFGPSAASVPAAWMWGRVNQRSAARRGLGEKLGYLRGGFKQLFDALYLELGRLGVEVLTSTQVQNIDVCDGRVRGVGTTSGEREADAVVYAGTLDALPTLLPKKHHDPRWSAIGRLGVICVVLELSRPVSGIYWTNVCDPALPFGGIIEHTNMLPPDDYGGRHVVYLSRYFTPEEAIASSDTKMVGQDWARLLADRVGTFSPNDILAINTFKTGYAAPLVTVGYLKRLPPIEGPAQGLYLATTAQIYPQDRGMDEGVKAGYRTATAVDSSLRLARV
jgi:protoporphyrinogen oxidase